jgi:hypothetical protein
MATLLKVLNNLADIKSAGGVALRVRTQDSAFEAAFGEGCEETLNGVEPGGRGRREVEGPSTTPPVPGES